MATDTLKQAKFDRVFNEHYDAISRYCHRRLPPDDANEATAEVFVVAWRKIDAAPDTALPWLYGVARNEVNRVRRSIRRRNALSTKLGGQAPMDEPGPESVVVRHVDQVELLAALGKLRPADQEVLRLRAYEHLSLAEVAIALGCTVEAAKKRSARALRRLRIAAGYPDPHDAVSDSRAIRKGGGE